MATTKQQKFYSETYAGARERGLSDVQARLAAAQAALETGYGRSVPGGNLFGIKAGASWSGPSTAQRTWEDTNEGPVSIVDKFRSYANPFDSIGDWASTVGRRWGGAMEAQDFPSAANALNAGQPGGYATDRAYNSKLGYIDRNFSDAAVQDYGLLGREVPTPQAAPRGILDAIGRPEAQAVNMAVREPTYSNMAASVQRGPTLSEPKAFDSARFGDAPATENFDSTRFGTATTPNDVAGLRDAMQRQQAELSQQGGILGVANAASQTPSMSSLAEQYGQYGMGQSAMQSALANKNLAMDIADTRKKQGLAPLDPPGYVDPQVTTAQPTPEVYTPVANPSPVSTAAPRQAGLLSPAAAPSMTQADALRMERALSTRGLLGGILGGVVGGGLLGPLGAMAGGYVGKQTGLKSYYPDAPKTAKTEKASKDSLNERGRDTYSKSGQFRDAVSSGKGGLW